ncbi:membrane hypothetical protein [Candidatus Sulfotelmatobacter kueseliae]|uniref:Uncharacterized protein n=1 Tax=Candidatus Sulfotelmatobacter kueseliae TaxID=2042962 RepID=A0A2U3L5U9_9BACT|nr:membrane hypothetical protein [Candidatus Sulfotelmatobacter kueseliae]
MWATTTLLCTVAKKHEVTGGDLRLNQMLVKRNVRVRLRYVLPVAQILLAIGLFAWSDAWFREARRHSTMPGPSPGFTILISLNAPLALPRELYYRHTAIPELYDRVVLLCGIALLWYWVARNIEGWRERRTVVTFRRLRMRIAADLILIGLGGFWAFVVVNERLWNRMSIPDPTWIWILAVFTPIVLWAVALIFFFGRDLIQVIRGENPRRANASPS